MITQHICPDLFTYTSQTTLMLQMQLLLFSLRGFRPWFFKIVPDRIHILATWFKEGIKFTFAFGSNKVSNPISLRFKTLQLLTSWWAKIVLFLFFSCLRFSKHPVVFSMTMKPYLLHVRFQGFTLTFFGSMLEAGSITVANEGNDSAKVNTCSLIQHREGGSKVSDWHSNNSDWSFSIGVYENSFYYFELFREISNTQLEKECNNFLYQ